MSARTTTIAVSHAEKRRLDEIAQQVYGESETIPYGTILTMLMDEFQGVGDGVDVEVDDGEEKTDDDGDGDADE